SLRADRFVGDWKSLSAQRDALKGWEHTEVRQAVETRMEAMAQGLGRDAELYAVLNGRRKDLGLELDKRLERGRDLPAELTGALSRSLGLGLSR
ncbi:MAG: MobA/MobL protein, partial [Caulobacteraceae bacterium]|nr:MobA/MobL protein [Caulobacteraceae bacterium]